MNIALLAHHPSDETKRFIRQLPGEWVIYNYHLHLDQYKDMEAQVLACVKRIATVTPLMQASRILIAPPGLSLSVVPFCEGIRGFTGVRPEILILLRNGAGQYVPNRDLPIYNPSFAYEECRKARRDFEGVVA